MISHSFYESDNRVLRYAESLAARGDDVEILALRRTPEQPVEETINGVKLFRIQDRFGKKEKSKSSFLWPLLRFLFLASWWVMRRHWKRRFNLIHVHNIPDFLVFSAWYPKLMGAKVILDIHRHRCEIPCPAIAHEVWRTRRWQCPALDAIAILPEK